MKTSHNQCLRFVVVVLTIGLLLALPLADVHGQTWKLGKPIVSCWSGPGFDKNTGLLTDVAAKQLVDAGMNLVWAGSVQELDVAKRYGLRVLYIDRSLITPAVLDNPALRPKLDALIDGIRNHPALYAYFLIDEPSAVLFGDFSRLVDYLRHRDPAHLAYINLLPTYASNEQLGTKGDTVQAYAEHLRQYVATVRPSLISYDHYHFTNAGDDQQYLLNLSMIRKTSTDAGLPFLNTVQASNWLPCSAASPATPRVPTGNETRFLVYTTLAYGAQGISYYVWCYPDHQGGIVQKDSTPTAIYDVLKATNHEFVNIAEQYQPLQWIGTHLKGYRPDALPPGTTLLPNDSPFDIREVSNTETYKEGTPLKGVLIGLFGEKNALPAGATHALVVNLDYTAVKTYTVTGPKNLSVFHAATGKWTAMDRCDAVLKLSPGGGVLVKLE